MSGVLNLGVTKSCSCARRRHWNFGPVRENAEMMPGIMDARIARGGGIADNRSLSTGIDDALPSAVSAISRN